MGKFDRLKSVSLLYVEDSKFLAKTTIGAIEKIFNKIYVAHDGQEGLELFSKHENEIDIIITDLIMPFLDGTSMIKKIRDSGSSVPIIVTTGFDDFLQREKIAELSIEAYLSKPINIYKLLKIINKTVESLFIERELMAKKMMIDNDIIYTETNETGVITYVSKPFEKISGYKKDELVGRTHAILKDALTPKTLYEDMWSNLKALKQWHGELTNRRKDGSAYTISIIISPMYFRDRLIGYSSTSIDVTQLRATSQKLQLKSKQAAMGEMIAMIAHQWRQPITSIGMIANNLQFDMLMDELDKDSLQKNLKTIDKHVKYLSSTIDVFRNFLKENKKKEKISMKSTIEDLLMLVNTEHSQKDIAFEIVNECEDFELNIFKDELLQAIVNVVTNSKEALIENRVDEAKIKIHCNEDAEAVYIHISDNAGGIKDDILPKIFTPYFSTKSKKNGTGLGLYMTKTIVEENLDGELSVVNKDDGAIFSIKLPK